MKQTLTLAAAFAFPLVASAQGVTDLRSLIGFAGDILNRVIPILIVLALVAFFWGVVMYVWKRDAGAMQVMAAGLIGLFVMVSVWGIVRIAQNTFGVANSGGPSSIPQVPYQR